MQYFYKKPRLTLLQNCEFTHHQESWDRERELISSLFSHHLSVYMTVWARTPLLCVFLHGRMFSACSCVLCKATLGCKYLKSLGWTVLVEVLLWSHFGSFYSVRASVTPSQEEGKPKSTSPADLAANRVLTSPQTCFHWQHTAFPPSCCCRCHGKCSLSHTRSSIPVNFLFIVVICASFTPAQIHREGHSSAQQPHVRYLFSGKINHLQLRPFWIWPYLIRLYFHLLCSG